ncbi:MAG: RNB domain-containing ribonuclease, partial [Flavobacteriales bacterium]|nr:RNB domain-containing ribonuclease [Flavobacteriales bacterium]
MKKKIKNKKRRSNSSNLKDLKIVIIDLCNSAVTPLSFKDICKELKVKDKVARHQISFVLKNLLTEGSVKEFGHGKYGASIPQDIYEGKIEKVASGAGYVICKDLDQDVFVSSKNAGQTLGGDVVNVVLTGKNTGKNPDGVVVSIVKRGRKTFVGNMRVDERSSFMTPDNSRIGTDFYIPKDKLNGAKNGDKVTVNLLDWPKKAKSPFAEVSKVMGAAGDHNTEIHAILAEYGLPYEFPEAIEKYVASIPEAISEKEISKRRDMRAVLTFTIDPHDAKDFDDALSYKELNNGNIEVGIHIADVSHYVQSNTELDKEAYSRGNSVYLVDREIPILP